MPASREGSPMPFEYEEPYFDKHTRQRKPQSNPRMSSSIMDLRRGDLYRRPSHQEFGYYRVKFTTELFHPYAAFYIVPP